MANNELRILDKAASLHVLGFTVAGSEKKGILKDRNRLLEVLYKKAALKRFGGTSRKISTMEKIFKILNFANL